MKKTAVVYVHGKGGSADEAAHYRSLFEGLDVIGFDYGSKTPWEAKEEFPAFFDTLQKRYGTITLIANSIGAYFALHALADRNIEKAFLISPVTDMEALILRRRALARVTEADLCARGEIPTNPGEALSWKYLCYAREHPVNWHAPTKVLYGEKDALVPFSDVSAFARRFGAELTVMPNGEHWFHTAAQMDFLDRWIQNNI